MAVPRFFLCDVLGATEGSRPMPLKPSDAHHAISVLRIKPGDEIEVVEPDSGGIWRVAVTGIADGVVEGRVSERLERAPSPSVTLVQGVAKGEKMDDIVRHAVEIGAAGIIPVLTERTIVRLDASKRAEKGERWRRIARSAAEQSHRDEIPDVADPCPLSEFTESMDGFDGAVVLWEDSHGQGLEAALASIEQGPRARVALIVGPEGGFSEGEVERLVEGGAKVASLGSGILRTETAALVSLALAIHHFGGLGRG